jgi:DNA processing protein
MNEEELFYTIALSSLYTIPARIKRELLLKTKSATFIFNEKKSLNDLIPEVSPNLVEKLSNSEIFKTAEKELSFIKKNNIATISLLDKRYPSRLYECDDAPSLLYFKGNCNFNIPKVVSIVGTRKITEYGKDLCRIFCKELKEQCSEVLIISGLAYGVDIHAHQGAMDNGFPTVGVLAHGLDRIYPAKHRTKAIKMLNNGGLLTEFPTGTAPLKLNFICRNRIVAGMSDATIVVESAYKGGALITADIASSYSRDCFAFAGRTNDTYSQGCNRLIKENKAGLIQNATDFVQAMGWKSSSAKQIIQRELFVSLTKEEESIVELLQNKEELHINTLAVQSNLSVSKVSVILFELEMKGIVRSLAGGQYRLLSKR